MQHPLHHRLLLAMFFSASVVAAATTSSEATRVHNLNPFKDDTYFFRRSNRKQEQQPPSIHFTYKNINYSTTSTAHASLLTTTSRRENATTPRQHAGDILDSHSTTASSLQKPISRRGAQTNLLLFICVARRIMKSQHSGVVPRLSFTNSVDSVPMNGTLITPLHPAVAVTTVVHVKRKFQKKNSASSIRKFIDRMVLPHEDALSSESICHQRTSIVESMLTKMIHGMLFFFFFSHLYKRISFKLWIFLFLFYSYHVSHTAVNFFYFFKLLTTRSLLFSFAIFELQQENHQQTPAAPPPALLTNLIVLLPIEGTTNSTSVPLLTLMNVQGPIRWEIFLLDMLMLTRSRIKDAQRQNCFAVVKLWLEWRIYWKMYLVLMS